MIARLLRGTHHLPAQTQRTQEEEMGQAITALGGGIRQIAETVHEKLHNTFGFARSEPTT